MHKPLLLLSTLLLLCCGKSKQIAEEVVAIDMAKAVPAFIEDIAAHVNYVPLNLPEDIYLGVAYHIKTYDNYLFIHDQYQTKTITVVDASGNFVTQLNSIGGGPGEYENIDAFSFDNAKKELVIYDRNNFNFITYSFPELKHLNTLRKDEYIMNFEILDSKHWFVITESDAITSNNEGMQLWNNNYELVNKLTHMTSKPGSLEISYPNTISRTQNTVYYAHPHEYTTIYQLDGNTQIPKISIDFGPNKIPSKYWETLDANEFEEAFTKGLPKTVWVQNVALNTKKISFWAMHGDIDTKYLISHNRDTKQTRVISELKLKGTDMPITEALGVVNQTQISLIYPEEFDDIAIAENQKLSKALLQNKENLNPILIFYQL